MRRGQTTLEYILLIGVVAAGIIAMIVYVSRGHQGHLRSQADQLGAGQYAPGNTIIVGNQENKTLKSSVTSASSTTVKHSAHPIGEKNDALEALLVTIEEKLGKVWGIVDSFEQKLPNEGLAVAAAVYADLWPWSYTAVPAGECYSIEIELRNETEILNDLNNASADLAALWPAREPDKTLSSGTIRSENGTIDTNKYINESLGDL